MRLDLFLERPGVFNDRPWTIVVTESNLGLVTTFRMSWWPVPTVSCAGGLPRSECSALAGTQEYLRDARIRADWQRGFINNFANQVGDGCDVTNCVTGTINEPCHKLIHEQLRRSKVHTKLSAHTIAAVQVVQ